jgi:CheY-like chemotaxis protein
MLNYSGSLTGLDSSPKNYSVCPAVPAPLCLPLCLPAVPARCACVGADVVVCDLFMPDCDGFQVIRQLRRDFPAVKIIAISNGKMDVLPIGPAPWGLTRSFTGRSAEPRSCKAIEEVLQKPAWTLASATAAQCPPCETLGAGTSAR